MCECCTEHNHMHTETLKVEGMSCGHCKKAVEDIKQELNGIENVEVNLDTGQVVIEHNPNLITIDAIKAAIIDKGYSIVD
ncbi:copper chaperone [Desulfonispora thiosulfatigenes DSM 11270]|uniref:Copper chaperone n=1 Tax=Desulfonispora thiosulfatigenes DSM 11270 TaxID=656914 RepID=A0A1W1VUC5_DESTI|nr:cation transporter [Desulfonispora thiosulfatigenes]SMB96494.1 copper chaperone [Desulfonispora thiosulfatigenes DSM 11270]